MPAEDEMQSNRDATQRQARPIMTIDLSPLLTAKHLTETAADAITDTMLILERRDNIGWSIWTTICLLFVIVAIGAIAATVNIMLRRFERG